MSSTSGFEQLPLAAKLSMAAVWVLALAVLCVAERKRRRRYRSSLQRVKERPPCPQDDFARELGLTPGTADAEVAITSRQAFAEWLQIPEGSLRADTLLTEPDLRALGDSLDTLELVFLLEARLDTSIASSLVRKVLLPFYKGSTFGQTIQSFVALVVHPSPALEFTIRVKHRDHNDWIARVPELYGVVAHGRTQEKAIDAAKNRALQKLAVQWKRIVPKAAANFTVHTV